MSQGKWACRPTPRRKSLRRIVAERLDVGPQAPPSTRRKQRTKQWDWLQKQATALFVAYAEPGRPENEEVVEERQG